MSYRFQAVVVQLLKRASLLPLEVDSDADVKIATAANLLGV